MGPARGAGGGRGRSSAAGLHAIWERQQQVAKLAAAVGGVPHMAASKPAFLASQLQPVLAALQQAAGAAAQGAASEAQGAGPAEPAGPEAGKGQQQQQQLVAAAAHLRRLVGIDGQSGANACLLLWLLLGTAADRDQAEADAAGPFLHRLFSTVGWQALLLEALPLLAPAQQRRLQALILAAAAAAAADSGATQQQQAVEQLVSCLASRTRQQLEDWCAAGGGDDSSSNSSSEAGGNSHAAAELALLADMALLQQLLLVCPAAAVAAVPAAALGQLQGTADACMARVVRGMQRQQQPGQLEEQQREQQQAVFQQLCQLRARIMLASAAAVAGAGAGSTGAGGAEASTVLSAAASQPGMAPLALANSSAGSHAAASQVWRSVLIMPQHVGSAPAGGSSYVQPSQHHFLAACLAAGCYLRALSGTVAGSIATDAEKCRSCGASASVAAGLSSLDFQTSVDALPGVEFLPALQPPLPGAPAAPPAASNAAGSDGSQVGAMAAAGEAAAGELQHNPACLGPVQLAMAALHLAQQCTADAAGTAAEQEEPAGRGAAAPSGGEVPGSACWAALLELAAAAAATATEPHQRQQLLLMLLHGQRPWQQRLRRLLAADQQLQQRCRRELVAVANRLASEPGNSGAAAAAPAVVHGERRQRRTAAAVAALLPHALLCPGAVLYRLVQAAVVQAGGQVGLVLDVLHEMSPLAAYPAEGLPQQQPLLLMLLAQLAVPGPQHQPVLNTPGSREAFLQLAGGLCGAASSSQAAPAASDSAAAAARGATALLSPGAVLQHVAAPALQRAWRRQQGGAQADLLLPLQLTALLTTAVRAAPASPASMPALQQLLGGLLDFEARRIDRSPAALQASLDAFELAASVLQRAGSHGAGAAGALGAAAGAGAYFEQQLLPLLQARQLPQLQLRMLQLPQLQLRMLQLLAALLPSLSASEAAEVLAALPAVIQAALMPATPRQLVGHGSVLPGAHAAAVEAACRAAQVLALQAEQAPIAGEGQLQGAAAGPAAHRPSALRQVAVERMLQRITQHCARLAPACAGAEHSAAAAGAAAADAATVAGRQQLSAADGQALGLRCFRELCKLAAALQPAHYDTATLKAGLLQLTQQLLPPEQRADVPEAQGPSPEQQLPGGRRQQPLLPRQLVQEQLAAAAGVLPPGGLREVVLLGIQQTL